MNNVMKGNMYTEESANRVKWHKVARPSNNKESGRRGEIIVRTRYGVVICKLDIW